MSEFPSLAEVLAKHWVNNCWWHCDGGTEMTPATHAQHQADAWREACTIRTVEELDALCARVMVRDDHGEYFDKLGSGWDCLSENGEAGLLKSTAIRPPALLIWHPDWDVPQ